MLHPLNEATCADALRQLVRFQREVLAFACSPATSDPPTKAEVSAFFSMAQDWFWKKLWKYGNPTRGASDLQTLLAAVIQFMHASPTEQAPALEAFDNDVNWTRDLTDAAFTFRYGSALSAGARDVIAPLMQAFYTQILDDGIPPEIHGGTGTIKLGDFKDAFWEANADLRACPTCDRQKPDYVRDKDTSDADHFLPKSLYPYLSVHPRNLVPVCMECNQRAKLGRDPIRNHTAAALPSTFHPYDRLTGYPALQVSVVSQPSRAGALTIALSEGGASPTPRLESVREVWDLEGRWAQRLRDAELEIVSAVQEAGMFNPAPITLAEFRPWLQKLIRKRSNEIAKQPNRILQVSYLRFVLDTPAELNRLLQEFNAA